MEQTIQGNRLMLAGHVMAEPAFSHAVRGVNFMKFPLSVERTSGTADVLPVLIPELKLPKISLIDTNVAVTGQIRSYLFTTAGGVERLLINAYARAMTLPEGELSLNEVELTGTIVRPVTYRTTPRLREIADIQISVPRGFQKEDLIPVIAWGKNARRARELLVGDQIALTGRLQSRSYTKLLPDGTAAPRTTYEVSCSTFTLL